MSKLFGMTNRSHELQAHFGQRNERLIASTGSNPHARH
jgi:hypothetical protein